MVFIYIREKSNKRKIEKTYRGEYMTATVSMSIQTLPQPLPQSTAAAVSDPRTSSIQFGQTEGIQTDSANFSHQKNTQSSASSAVVEPLLPFLSLTSEFRVDNFDISQLPEMSVPDSPNVFSTMETNHLAIVSSFALKGQTILDCVENTYS